MNDLFDIFPDLPYPAEKPVTARVGDVRARAEQARERMKAATVERKQVADRVRQAWEERVRRRRPGG